MNAISKPATETPLAALLHQNILEVFSGFLLVSVYCLIFGFYYSEPMVWYWTACMFLLYAMFYLGSTFCITFKKDNEERVHWLAMGLMMLGMFLNGLGWSFLIISSLWQNGFTSSSTIMAIAFCSIRAISCVGNFYGNPKFIISFLTAVAIPALAYAIGLHPEESLLVIACSLLLFGSLLFVSLRIHKLVQKVSSERSERDHFFTLFSNARRELEQLKVSSIGANEKQTWLEQQLNSANQQLDAVQSRAKLLESNLEDINPYDTETGLIRVNSYKNILSREWERMENLKLPISALHISIDDYEGYQQATDKSLRVGHLQEIAKVFQQSMNKPGDVCARINDDQFVMLLPETNGREAQKCAYRINHSVELLQIPHPGNSIHANLTVSVGCACMFPQEHTSAKDLSERAASALYEASFHCGNRVTAYQSLNNLRLEHWDPAVEGHLTESAMMHKLANWGYSAEQCHYEPGTSSRENRAQSELIHAVLHGKLKVSLEGESIVLSAGDCLFIPKGQASSIEVVGRKPVVCLEAERSELILDTIH